MAILPILPSLPLTGLLLALLPVLCFLGMLLYLESYKLVTQRTVLMLVGLGALQTVLSYFVTAGLLALGHFEFDTFTVFGSPLSEELIKALAVIWLIRSHRIGFLVDAAILGFATGAGFGTAENLYFLHTMPDASIALWIARGFGTAIMHGGATALFAIVSMAMLERKSVFPGQVWLPGLLVAVLLHSGFNELHRHPTLTLLMVLMLVPLLLHLAFKRGEKVVGDWLGRGFDADAEMLELIMSGDFTGSPAGSYLTSLKDRFKGLVVADLLCYLRLSTELTLRAKGVLLMRENGFSVPIDAETHARFVELKYLRGSIGKTGLLALQPMLHTSHSDLWQMFLDDPPARDESTAGN